MTEPGGRRVRVVYEGPHDGEDGREPDPFDGDDRFELDRVTGAEAVLDALDGDAVDCLVLGRDLGAAVDVASAVRERDPDLPIVLYPPEPDPGAASEALRAGATEYLPRTVDGHESTLPDLVRGAAESYADRRERRRRSERYRALMTELPKTIYFKDAEARFVDVSEWFSDVEERRLIGRTDVEVWGDVPDVSAVESYEDDLRIVETGEPLLDEERRREIGGESYWNRETKVPWRDRDGEVVGVVGVTDDVTEYRETERELRKRVGRLDAFASFVSHDLRNPMTVAYGNVDRARRAEDPAERAEAVDAIENAVETMEGLVDDLLAMARPGETDASPVPVDLSRLVDDVWTTLDSERASLRNDVPDGTRIDAIEGQLRQLLSNLLQNALDHAGPDVEVVVGLSPGGFYVADDGPGLAVDDPDAVFEYGHTSGGTGIGLALVSEIAETHGWSVSARNRGRPVDEAEADRGDERSAGARFDVSGCLVRTPEYRNATEGASVPLTDSTDVGEATPPGSSTPDESGDAWTLSGGGRDLWEEWDEHHFAYATLDPPVRVEATVTALDAVHEYSKAGVMVRDAPTAGSPLGFAVLTGDHGTEVGGRSAPGDRIVVEPFEAYAEPPRRYRLDLFESRVTCHVETDDGWATLGQRPLRTTGPVAAGLAVCGHDVERRCEAVFEDVRVVELRSE